ncbi:protein ycf2 [Phtheirospermum japonicum]|uniref:Protein ycf2 n=1 Tax=Phtheirospermum japonicum TaxID=374723 RepID=A0A830CF75_9LAMI|nr:protein ycf2 [Phtheirospermum japonicum]
MIHRNNESPLISTHLRSPNVREFLCRKIRSLDCIMNPNSCNLLPCLRIISQL